MSAVYRKFCFEGRQNAHSGVWGLSLASICVQCGFHLPRGSSVCTWAGSRPLWASASLAGVSGSSPGSRGYCMRHCTWRPEDRSTEPMGCLEKSPHRPYAPTHGSLLTFNSGDFRYWLIFLSLFGDSEFHEGKNHDFFLFFLMVLCWRDTQQIVECMSGWMNEWGSTNQSSSGASSLIGNKLPDLTWKPPHSGSAAHFRVWVPLGMPTAAQPWDHGGLLLAPKTCLVFSCFWRFFFFHHPVPSSKAITYNW